MAFERMQRAYSLRFRYPVLTVVFFGLLATCLAFLLARSMIERDEEQRFQMARQNVDGLVHAQMDRFTHLLRLTRAFLSTKETVSREDFRRFFQNIDLSRSYSGLRAVVFVEAIPTSHLKAHSREVREDGFRHYHVWPRSKNREIFPVKFVEPLDPLNRRALGFDMLSEPTRRDALLRARDSGKPTLSAKLPLLSVANEDSPPGFLLFLPIYKRGWKTDTVAQRRRALTSLVACPLRAEDFFGDVRDSDPLFREGIGLEVFDGPSAQPANLLFSSTTRRARSGLSSESTLQIADHEWTVRVFTTPEFATRSDRYAPLLVALTGILSTFLVAWIVFASGRQAEFQQERAASEQRARKSFEGLAKELKVAVQENTLSLAQQEKMVEIAQIISAELDVDKVVQAVTDAARTLSRAEVSAFFYNNADQNGETYVLYALSGAPREHFQNFPTPRNTEIFRPTFSGAHPVRSDDITQDSRYGRNAPYQGLPPGHFPVKSYLAVSVVSRSGEVIGGIFLGHSEKAVFTAREEKVVQGLAAQAAIAIDNARLFQKNREAIATRDEFLSICSHELRTPLTSLKLQNQLIERSLAQTDGTAYTPDRFPKLVHQSGVQIDRLVRLVEEMLDISRIRSGKLTISPERINLTALARETLERFAPQINALKYRVDLVAPDELYGTWDRLRLEQVLVNLLTNALKYGQGKPIHIELSSRGANAVISVEDQGLGIAPEHQSRIFERFERAVSKSEISGLGLGLYIVSQIVELHGGTIRVASELGRGSRFVVELPLHYLQPDLTRPHSDDRKPVNIHEAAVREFERGDHGERKEGELQEGFGELAADRPARPPEPL